MYCSHCYGESLLRSTIFRLVAVLWLLCFIMLDMTLFTKLFYYISSENQLLRGPLYPLMVGVLYVIIILNLISVIRHRSKLSKRYYLAFLTGLLPMAIIMFIHSFLSI